MYWFLRRSFVIVLAYASACFAAGLVIGRVSTFLLPAGSGGFFEDSFTQRHPFHEAYVLAVIIGIVMLLPTTLVSLVAWALDCRWAAYYIGTSMVAACLLYLMIVRQTDTRLVAILAGAAVGGFVYWLIVGRIIGLRS